MVEILFELQESLKRVAEKFRMTQSVRDIFVLLFRLDGHIVLVSFAVIVVSSDRPVESFFLPFDDMLELLLGVPGSVGDESILILEGPVSFVHDISARKTEIRELLFCGPVFAEVGVDTWDSILVGSVKLCDGSPYLSLHFEVVFEVVYDIVVLFDFDPIVVLVELASDVMRRAGVLMRKRWIGFIVHDGIFFDLPQVRFLLLERKERQSVAFFRAESAKSVCYLPSKH